MSGNILGHDSDCDCWPCDNERMQKELTKNSPCNFCLPTRKAQAKRIGELECQKTALQQVVADGDKRRRELEGELFLYKKAGHIQIWKEQKERIAELETFIKNIHDNYDCDSDQHKYNNGVGCRCCDAKKLLG